MVVVIIRPTSINPSSGEIYGADFPVVSVTDWVNSQKMLMDYFEIDCWEFVVGGSFGGAGFAMGYFIS